MEIEMFGQTIELDTIHVAEPNSPIDRQLAEYETGERKHFFDDHLPG